MLPNILYLIVLMLNVRWTVETNEHHHVPADPNVEARATPAQCTHATTPIDRYELNEFIK